MKRRVLLLTVCTTLLVLTGCSTNQLSETVTTITDTGSSPTVSEAPAATATPAPEAETLSLGKKTTLGDWKICAKKATVKQKIKNGKYQYYKPGKGKSFVVISLSARNNGKKTAAFLPRIGYKNEAVFSTLCYKDEYEYSPTELLSYDKDLTTEKIQPLSTESGVLAFEVPKKVAKSKKNLVLKFTLDDQTVSYSIN